MMRTLSTLRSLPELFTAAKAFDADVVLGNEDLNRWGLHAARVRLAYMLAQRRRRRLASALRAADRAAFDHQGFVVLPEFLPRASFQALVEQVRTHRTTVRERAEGSTLLRKIPIDKKLRVALPALASLLDDERFRALLAYGEGHRAAPAAYLQSITQNALTGAPDPQCALHRDTFHPTVKAWLYLHDVSIDAGPLVYVPGSQRLDAARLAWEHRRSLIACAPPRRREGAFRITDEELAGLGLGPAQPLPVAANTLIVADTFGFHARGTSARRSTRAEVWAFGRRSPFVDYRLDWGLQRLARPPRDLRWAARHGATYDGA